MNILLLTKMRARTTAIGLVTAALLTGLAVGPAHAAPPTPRGLPPIGEDDYLNLSDSMTMEINGQQCTATMSGGIDEQVTNTGPRADQLSESGFGMQGTEDCGYAQSGGSITIEQNDVDVDPKSLLKLTQQFPPKYEQIMVLSFTMVIEQPDGQLGHTGRAPAEPLILTTKDPAKLIGQLTQFPPNGDLYQLQNPVDLVLPDEPDVTVATIEKFPVKVGGL